ncbi:SDR family NAD(P)-dependent oxidoreductase [Lentzea sp. CC55]|uniref:SDR family NAD(P)-dependent oxidoreductase n=1 Tax=Lentzea sp. CC55 TaxID=2884909 RepID=UPI001F25C86F|nr:SDR family oxidoreductase [Lentzea sp. CC55]MCG8927698.1 SDR family oxidoreductase [Lentzea sp. CC55]
MTSAVVAGGVVQPYALRLVARPATPRVPEREPLPPGALVLTDDAEIADRVRATAGNDVTVVLVPETMATSDEETVTGLLAAAGPVGGHLRVITSLRDAEWPASPRQGLVALQETVFVALKRLAGSAHDDSSVAILVLDRLDGGAPHPHCALLTGLAKSVVWELPETHVHALVTDAGFSAAVAQLRVESGCAKGLPVAYYRTASAPVGRWEERLVPFGELAAAVGHSGAAGPVVVAAGGARGITARCLEGMSPPPSMLWLLGSTEPEAMTALSAEIGDLSGADYVRAKRLEDPGVHIAALRATYDRARQARESLTTIEALRERIGADRVRYLGCDVTDPAAVRRAAATVAADSSRIDLLVNGAGIGGARRLRSKDLATFRRVRDTKIAGHHNLKAAFRDPAPSAWCTFSSVAGAFGLPGEIDYGPANDVLNAAARYEQGRGSHAECAIGWSLWGESGIGPRTGFTDYTAKTGQLGLLGDAEGQRLFASLVAPDRIGRHPSPVLLGEAERRLVRTRFPGLVDDGIRLPYLSSPPHTRQDDTVWPLDLSRHDHLRGHVRQSRALVPGALVLELAAHATDHLAGHGLVDRFQDIRFGAPVAVDPQLAEYTVAASFMPSSPDGGVVRVAVQSQLEAGNGDRRVTHVELAVPLGDDVTTRLQPPRPSVRRAPATMSMSGLFDQVRDCHLVGDTTSARWEPSLTAREFFSSHRLPWLLIDALLQTACATGVPHRYATPLSITEVRLHTRHNDLALADQAESVHLHVAHEAGVANGVATTDGGTVLVTLTGLVLSGRDGVT